MMLVRILLAMLVLMLYTTTTSAQITYTKADSLKVVELIREGRADLQKNPGLNLMIYYGHKLKKIPYVAATLEVNKTEQLVVNMREMDCTTFVETVLALRNATIDKKGFNATGKKNLADWQLFCMYLKDIRYSVKDIQGYTSRNHYFIWWAENNDRKGYVSLPLQNMKASKLLSRQKISINYMSTHPSSYSMLKGNKADIATIAKMEKATEGKTMMYIPKGNLGLSKKELSCIHDGDILAICTKKLGLDTTHIGIAEWGRDGKLHLLNASQIHKMVVTERMTLQTYMSKHPVQLGVWVLEVK